MAISDIIKEIRDEKKLKPGKLAMDFLSSPSGVRLIKGIIKTKTEIDKRVKSARDFAGVPSFSDQDKVERAIGRIGSRLKDVESQLDELDNYLKELEKSSEDRQKRRTEKRKETVIKTRTPSEKPRAGAQSLTNVIDLLKPAPKRKIAAKPKTKDDLKAPASTPSRAKGEKTSKKKGKKASKKTATPFTVQPAKKSASGSLLDFQLKK